MRTPPLVMKFGGTSVADATAIARAVSLGLIVSTSGDAGRLWGNIISAVMGLTYALTVVLARMERNVPTTEATLLGVIIVAIVFRTPLPSASTQRWTK